jgi:uncharacterized repeat protein (TIGR01451 family)
VQISNRVIALVLLAVSACQDRIDTTDASDEVKSTSCVLAANKWGAQRIWPVTSMKLGTVSYTEAQLRVILGSSVRGNGLVELAKQLIAAKLNFAMGASAPDFVSTIAAADAMIGSRVVPPVGSGFLATSLTNALASKLGSFNTGSKNAGPCVGPQADVAVTMRVDNSKPRYGDDVVIAIDIANHGPVQATGVTIDVVVPDGLDPVVSGASGIYTTSLAPDQTLTIFIQAKVVSADPQTTSATITMLDQYDPDLSNNAGSLTVTPQSADLELAAAVDNAKPAVGDEITFTITLTNNGPQDATGVTVNDELPANLSSVTVTPSTGTYSTATGDWVVGALASGDSETLEIHATVDAAAVITDSAVITTADQADPASSNDMASVAASSLQADVQILSMDVSDTEPQVGDTITYTIRVFNNGPAAATGVVVTIVLPPEVRFDAARAFGGFDPATGEWAVGDLPLSETIEIDAVVVSAGSATCAATVTDSDQTDPVPGNNADSVSILAGST